MNISEYKKINKLNYFEYCDYLKNKYGNVTGDYYFPNFKRNFKISRTTDGLVVHHIKENVAILLSREDCARQNPYEYQKAHNLVYADFLEHLLLHILICEENKDMKVKIPVGIQGILIFQIPELNDIYSGYIPEYPWQKHLYDKVINDKKVYLKLVKRFKHNCNNYPLYDKYEKYMYTSLNARNNKNWDNKNDQKILKKIKKI